MINRRKFSQLSVVPAVLALGALSACGGGETNASSGDEEVASLETEAASSDDGAADEVGGDAAVDEIAPDEAALVFSQCLRDEGLDVADIGVDADGNIDLRGAFENADRQAEEFQAAMEVCSPLIADVGFGGGRGGLADNTELADAFVELTDCFRAEGFEDVEQFTLGGAPGQGAGNGGGAPNADGGPPQGGQGQGRGGFADRGTAIASRLGLDVEDPEVVAAIDVCLPILDAAFADAGVGQPGAQND